MFCVVLSVVASLTALPFNFQLVRSSNCWLQNPFVFFFLDKRFYCAATDKSSPTQYAKAEVTGNSGPRKNALTHALHAQGVWGSVHYLVSPVSSGGLGSLIPTKTSRLVRQSGGRELSSCSIVAHVCIVLFLEYGFLLLFASRRSMSRRAVMRWSHREVIVAVV